MLKCFYIDLGEMKFISNHCACWNWFC